MPYAALSDVKGLIPSIPINATSQPSESTVAQWITDVEIGVNAALRGMDYVTPVTGPQSIAIIKTAVAHAIAAMVLRARPNPESDPEAFQKRYDAFFKALTDRRDPLVLIDATREDSATHKDVKTRVSSNLKDLLDAGTYISRDMKF